MKELIYYWSYLVFPFMMFLISYKKLPLFWRIFFILLSLLFIYSRFIETQLITINNTQINVWFESKIALISDTHLWIYKDEVFLKRVIDKINNIPDLDYVFIAWDFTWNPKNDELLELFEPLSQLSIPTYWVLWNHDVEKPGPKIREELIEVLDWYWLYYLNNNAVELNNFTLLWLGSNWNNEDDITLLNDYKETDNIIVLTHNPDTISKYTNYIADLTLAWHTHWWQIRIPIIYKDVIPTKWDFDKWLTQEKYTQLFISSWLWETAIPMRLFNPPVIDILVLK
jgi:predicted MPP superfamily phosphohydrolase